MEFPFFNYEVKLPWGKKPSLLQGSEWRSVRTNPQDERFVKKEEIEIELPVKGGRSSTPDGVGLLSFLYNEFAQVNPEFNIEFLKAMEYLAMYNADFSLAVENIISLGNTDYTVTFDDNIPAELAKEMHARLKNKGRKWYNFSEGVYSLVNDLLAQTAIGGALSAEIVPDKGLTGIEKVVLVAPKGIRFVYSQDDDRYKPHQMTSRPGVGTSGLKPLTETTYKYFALRRFNENPYGIPPMLSALENITIDRDMVCNMQNVIKKLGVLGFLSVLLNKPARLPGNTESETAYQARCLEYLQKVAPEVDKSMAKGFVVGFKDSHEFKLDGVLQNVSGAKDIIEINNQSKFAGLKQDPLMMGRSYTTSETLGRVVLAKLSTQVVNYQKLVAAFLRELFLMDLILAGYPVKSLEVVFEKPMIGDKAKDEETFSKRIDNYTKLRNEGYIDQDTAAQALGYEKAAAEGPLFPPVDPNAPAEDKKKKKAADPAGTKKTDPSNNIKELIVALEVELGIDLPEYNYGNDIVCGCNEHTHESLAKQPKDISPYEVRYRKETGAKYRAAVDKISKKVGESLVSLGQGASLEQVTDTIFYQLYKGWKTAFTDAQKAVIKKNIKEAYVFFRKNKAPFGGKITVPEATFGLVDTRTMTFFAEVDELYLGKFITDADTRKALTEFIKEEYVAKNVPLGSSEGLSAFKARFGSLLEGEEWKLDRIIATTVNKLRNYATVNYMTQAEVETFEIVGIKDRLTCDYCKELQGKQFSVTTAVTKAEQLIKSDPSTLQYDSPFVTSVFKKASDMEGLTAEQLQAKGIDLPPYHCNCRDVIVAVL